MIFDVEADGLLDEATKIHVLAYSTPNGVKYTHDYDEMREILSNAKLLIGHNIISYDVPLVEKLLGIKIKSKLIDTLPLSWYLNHSRNVHGLDSFGKDFGIQKPKIDDWENLTPQEYAHRCVEDVKINKALWSDLRSRLLELYEDKKSANRLINYLMFKMRCVSLQERSKWLMDKDLVEKSIAQLSKQEDEILSALTKVMPPVPKYAIRKRPAKPYKKDGTYSVTGARWLALTREHGLPFDYDGEIQVLLMHEEPNPGSSVQVKDWLTSLGWVPETYKYDKDSDGNEKKIPQVRVVGEVGKELCPSVKKLIEKEPNIELLESLTVIQHRLAIFRGFLNNVDKDGYLIAGVAGLTNTLRFKHRVLVNLPGVDKPWGDKIRGSLVARPGHVLCGSDMTSLEETTKKHFMFPYDPDFVAEMSKPGFDAHLDLAKYAGAVTQEEIDAYVNEVEGAKNLKPIRKSYKAANYACIYGVGAAKLARETGLTLKEAKALIEAYWARNWAVKALCDNMVVKHVGKDMWLFNPVSRLWYSLRNMKDVFSTLNQGTGVFCFDKWIANFLRKREQLTAQFHDEVVLEIKQGAQDKCTALLKEAIAEVNEELQLNVTLDVDIQFGQTYADIH